MLVVEQESKKNIVKDKFAKHDASHLTPVFILIRESLLVEFFTYNAQLSSVDIPG